MDGRGVQGEAGGRGEGGGALLRRRRVAGHGRVMVADDDATALMHG